MDGQPETETHVPKSAYLVGAVTGAIAAFIALLPVSAAKTYLMFLRLCAPLTADLFDAAVSPTTCGLFLNLWVTTATTIWIYILATVLGGALAGLWAAHVRVTKSLRDPQAAGQRPKVFWWSFGAGILFDVLFVFAFLYPGQ
jgi:hypothetical protein